MALNPQFPLWERELAEILAAKNVEYSSDGLQDEDILAATFHPGKTHHQAIRCMQDSERDEDAGLDCPGCRSLLKEVGNEF